jgi:Lhr-like helicase
MSELNSRIESIETITREKIQTRDASIINVNIILNSNEHINVYLHEVHYYLETNSNLLFLNVLKEKDHTFTTKNSVLRVLNSDENVVLVINKQRNVYVLHQFMKTISIICYQFSSSSRDRLA